MNHWKHAKKYGVLIVLICAALCFWLSQAQGAEMGSFSGKVFEDLNNDGIMDENDPGVAGWKRQRADRRRRTAAARREGLPVDGRREGL